MSKNSFFTAERFRFFTLIALFSAGFLLVIWKLFQLQVVESKELQERAQKIRNASVEIQARRGGIFVKDSKTNDIAPVALNTTLYNVFFDARSEVSNTEDFPIVAKELANILYTAKRHEDCTVNTYKCPEGSVKTVETEEGEIILEDIPSYNEAKQVFEENLVQKFSERKKSLIYVLNQNETILKEVEQAAIPHLYASFENKSVWVDLVGLQEDNRQKIAKYLAEKFHNSSNTALIKEIQQKLYSKRRGYILVMDRVYPEEIERIQSMQEIYRAKYIENLREYEEQKNTETITIPKPELSPFSGVGFEKNPVRYYPEGALAAQVVGFVNAEGMAQYGIERSMASVLQGKNGVISAARDVNGNTISIDDENSGAVIDGADIILTIDRILQKKVEKILDDGIEYYKADSAQAILVDPNTGKILVMASSPRFDLNFFGEIYTRKKVEENDLKSIYKTTPIEVKNEDGSFEAVSYETFIENKEEGKWDQYHIYENRIGPQVYKNKSVMEIYEPGSVFKPLVMAAAMDEGEITQHTTYYEKGPEEVDGFTIRNADAQYLGRQTMSNIIERSANIGMIFITNTMGASLTYEALKDMGFGEYTNIRLPEELPGKLRHYNEWARTNLYTAGYGQGVSATPLQVVRAWSSLASGGYRVNPYIIDEIRYTDGRVEKTEIDKTRIFSQDTIDTMTQILINSTEKGGAKRSKVKGHFIAGKTGTSQIVGVNGYECIDEDLGCDITGTTITSFVGFAPVEDPQYLLYVKYDRPRNGWKELAVFGSTTAAPTFAEIMAEVFEYYDVPRDKFY